MEKISGIDQCFNVLVANTETKQNNRKQLEDNIIKVFNECIIPAINDCKFSCEYSVEYGYIDERIIERLERLGYKVMRFSNDTKINIYWTSPTGL